MQETTGKRRLLATDMDGTLIPLERGDEPYASALKQLHAFLARGESFFAFVTGRQLDSILEAIAEEQLPLPDYLIADVGTTVYYHSGSSWEAEERFAEHLRREFPDSIRKGIVAALGDLEGLRPQADQHQREFKISYNCAAEEQERICGEIRARTRRIGARTNLVHTIDPWSGEGTIDLLPPNACKASALHWLLRELGIAPADCLFAGDSGNDREVFLSPIPSIVVANAADALREEIRTKTRTMGNEATVYYAKNPATAGLWEGVEHLWLKGKGSCGQ